MKRVLSSGSIKLPYIAGSEKEIIERFKGTLPERTSEELIGWLIVNNPNVLKSVQFTFEIKAPLLVFVEGFQRSKLGALTILDGLDHQMAYLPYQFYKQDALMFIPMDAKSCNEYNTRLNNFYNWSLNFYNKLIEEGLCESQATLVLPQGVFKTFLWKVNAKDLITFIETSYDKSPELFGYCSTLILYMEDHLPLVTVYLKRNQWQNLI